MPNTGQDCWNRNRNDGFLIFLQNCNAKLRCSVHWRCRFRAFESSLHSPTSSTSADACWPQRDRCVGSQRPSKLGQDFYKFLCCEFECFIFKTCSRKNVCHASSPAVLARRMQNCFLDYACFRCRLSIWNKSINWWILHQAMVGSLPIFT